MRLVLCLLASGCLCSPVALAQDKAPKEERAFTRPGRIDQSRFDALLAAEHAQGLLAADQLWRKRQYKEAAEAYARFGAQQAQASDARLKQAVPYALLMEGLCLLAQGQRGEARARFAVVLKDCPQGQDALLAAYHSGASHWDEGNEKEAFGFFSALAQAPERCFDPDILFQTRRWLKNYYDRRRRGNAEAGKLWLQYMDLVVSDPRRSSEEYSDLCAYYREHCDWENYKRLLAARLPPLEAEAEVLKAIFDALDAEHKQCADAPERLKDFRARAAAVLAPLPARLDALKAPLPGLHAELSLRRLKACCMFGSPKEAGELLLAWVRERPQDKVGMYSLLGFLGQGGEIELPAYEAACEEYLKANPQDAAFRDQCAKLLRDKFKAPEKGLAVLTRWQAGDLSLARFWDGLDDEKAAGHYVKAAKAEGLTTEQHREAAWGAAECLKRLKRYDEALAGYLASAKGAEAQRGAAECHLALGRWKEAATSFLDAAKLFRPRNVRSECQFRAAELLLEHSDPLGKTTVLDVVARGDARWSAAARELCKKHNIAIPEKEVRKKEASPDDIP